MGTNQRKRRANRRQVAFLVIFIAALIVGVPYYYQWSAKAELVELSFQNPKGNTSNKFFVEVAAKPREIETGLMYRRELAKDRGMLFVFPSERDQVFWMKNTYISLDLIFIDSNKKVVGILDRLPTLNEEKRRVGKPSKYVLEIPAGRAKQEGIIAGSKLIYKNS